MRYLRDEHDQTAAERKCGGRQVTAVRKVPRVQPQLVLRVRQVCNALAAADEYDARHSGGNDPPPDDFAQISDSSCRPTRPAGK
jgi:hypothetical protein